MEFMKRSMAAQKVVEVAIRLPEFIRPYQLVSFSY